LKIFGESFSEDKKWVIFPDGEKQKLGKSQLLRLQMNDIKPGEIQKGISV